MCTQLVQTVQNAITIAAVHAGIGMHNISSLALAVSLSSVRTVCFRKSYINRVHGNGTDCGPTPHVYLTPSCDECPNCLLIPCICQHKVKSRKNRVGLGMRLAYAGTATTHQYWPGMDIRRHMQQILRGTHTHTRCWTFSEEYIQL